jgi:predicted GNAT superfamily acetyltransferase
MNENVSIIRLKSISELIIVEKLQREIWGFSEIQIVDAKLMNNMQKEGGLVLGAINDQTKNIIGFLFGFVGVNKGKIIHYSDLLGILPQYRSKGIGYLLKAEQRKVVISQGIDLITWSYDPLESRNAYLNLYKLGGIAKEYKRDMFGSMYGKLNYGLPSDRVIIEWNIHDTRVMQRISKLGSSPNQKQPEYTNQDFEIINTTQTQNGILRMDKYDLSLNAPFVLLEIPSDIQKIKQIDINLALEWRLTIREIFEKYLSHNYVVVDFLTQIQSSMGTRKSYYILEQVTTNF